MPSQKEINKKFSALKEDIGYPKKLSVAGVHLLLRARYPEISGRNKEGTNEILERYLQDGNHELDQLETINNTKQTIEISDIRNESRGTRDNNADDITSAVGIIFQNIRQILLGFRTGTKVQIVYNEGNIITEYTIPARADREEIDEYITKTFFHDENGEYNNGNKSIFEIRKFKGRLHMYPLKDIRIEPENIREERYLDGHTHCVLQPIINYFIDKSESVKDKKKKADFKRLAKKSTEFLDVFKDGVPLNKFKDICDTLRVSIDLTLPIDKKVYHSFKTTNQMIKKFNFTITRFNHVEICGLTNNIIELENKDELIEVRKKLDTEQVLYSLKRGKININSIITPIATYIISNEYTKTANDFIDNTEPFMIDSIKNPITVDFIKSSSHSSLSHSFKTTKELELIQQADIRHIDQKKAFVAYRELDIYDGFMLKPTDFRKTDVVVGKGIYTAEIHSFPDTHQGRYLREIFGKYINKRYQYPDTDVVNLQLHGVILTIYHGVWGNSVDLNFEYKTKMIFVKNEFNINLFSVAKCIEINSAWIIKHLGLEANTNFLESYENKEKVFDWINVEGVDTDIVNQYITDPKYSYNEAGYRLSRDMIESKETQTGDDKPVPFYSKFIGCGSLVNEDVSYIIPYSSLRGDQLDFASLLKSSNKYESVKVSTAASPLTNETGGTATPCENESEYDFSDDECDEAVAYSQLQSNVKLEQQLDIHISYKKKANFVYPHIVSQIKAYQRWGLIEQLFEIPYSDIIKVNIDGIYYIKQEAVNPFELKNSFRVKPFDIKQALSRNVANDPLTTPRPLLTATSKYIHEILRGVVYNPKSDTRLQLHKGAGGSGKTHSNIIDLGNIDLLLAVPPHKLAAAKALEYPGLNVDVTSNLYSDCLNPQTTKDILKNYSTIILDEVSQMTRDQFDTIVDRFGETCKLIFVGDIGYQLPPVVEAKGKSKEGKDLASGIPLIEENLPLTEEYFTKVYDGSIVNYSKIYRQKCETLSGVLKSLRKHMTQYYSTLNNQEELYQANKSGDKELLLKLRIENAKTNEAITNRTLKKLKGLGCEISLDTLKADYTPEDIILTHTHKQKDTYTELFKELPKYRVLTKCSNKNDLEMYYNGNIVFSNEGFIPSKIQLQHAFTIHSIQGETCENTIYIDINKKMSAQMLYTALSRARTIRQIKLIGSTTKCL